MPEPIPAPESAARHAAPGLRGALRLTAARHRGLVLLVLAAACALGAATSPAWGWALAAGALVVALVFHVRHLAGLLDWLAAPTLDSVPEGKGVWEDAYAGLYHLLRRQRQNTVQLTASLDDFRRAGAAMPDGLVILGAEDRIDWCNPSAEHHFGLELKRDAGQGITYLVRQPQFVDYLRSAQYEEPLILRQSRTGDRVLAVQLVPYGEHQKLLLSRDVTDLERVETMRRDFVANVSHELRTPLTVLCGFLETLNDADPAMREALLARSVPLMLGQAQRMERLVSDLLTLSRLESGSNPVRHDEVNVPGLVRALHQEAQALAQGRQTIVLEAVADVGLVGAEEELRSAFGNLVSNAVRYTPEGGTITISWTATADEAVFSVSDTGIGIDARHIPRLTERFYRVDRGRSRESGGTGLGLAIVKHVLQRHQGLLEIASEAGRGSRFSAVFRGARIARPNAVDGET